MNRWLEYEYVVATQSNQCEFPALNDLIMRRIEMSPRRWWIGIADADAILITLDDMAGLRSTDTPDLFEFDGNRPYFDRRMAKHHPHIGYCWLDQYVIAFADRAAQLSFNDDLGEERVLRCAYLPRAVEHGQPSRPQTVGS